MISGKLNLPIANRESSSIKINLATPAYQSTYSSSYVRSLYSLLTQAQRSGLRFSFSEIDYSDIVVSRNYLISNFYFNKKDCDYILFLDSDMGFPSKLITEMVSLKEDVVGVIYPKRSIDLNKLHSLSKLSFAKAYAQSCSFIGEPENPHPANPSFRETKGCGTGILLISRECLKIMSEKCPEIIDNERYKRMPFPNKLSSYITPFNKINLPDRELSEDFSFCHRWTESCQGKIYANVTHDIEHTGYITIKSCHADHL
jgi:hypothetical protein